MEYHHIPVHAESYDDLARFVEDVGTQDLQNIPLAQIRIRQQHITQYQQRIRQLLEEHAQHIERLEGIQYNAEVQMNRLLNRERNELAMQALQSQQVRRNPTAATVAATVAATAVTSATVAVTLDTLIETMQTQNSHQADILRRIRPSYSGTEARDIFLSSYTPNTDTTGRRRQIQGEFTVLGSRRAGTRDAYTVTWYKPECPRSFWCSCPDQRFNGGKKEIYCKHISFLVCRVARILDAEFFRTKHLPAGLQSVFATRIQDSASLRGAAAVATVATAAPTAVPRTTNEIFRTCGKPIEAGDSCPICYDEFSTASHLSCPTCKNNVHQECMEVWLERNNSCVFCRSHVWSSYRR